MAEHRLVIDDCRRFDFPHVLARNVQEALLALESRSWDEVWWDFDLGGEFGEVDAESTALPILYAVEERAYLGQPYSLGLCVIHTANPVGRQMLQRGLSRLYKIRHVDAATYTFSVENEAGANVKKEAM